MWQDGIGTDRAPDLKLCKGSGAMVKPSINEVYAKKAAEDAMEILGMKLNWIESKYMSKRNNLTMLVVEEKPEEPEPFVPLIRPHVEHLRTDYLKAWITRYEAE